MSWKHIYSSAKVIYKHVTSSLTSESGALWLDGAGDGIFFTRCHHWDPQRFDQIYRCWRYTPLNGNTWKLQFYLVEILEKSPKHPQTPTVQTHKHTKITRIVSDTVCLSNSLLLHCFSLTPAQQIYWMHCFQWRGAATINRKWDLTRGSPSGGR